MVLLDLGGFVAGKRHGYGYDDSISLQCLERMRYDALVIGEGELVRGLEDVDSLLGGRDLRVVSNNVFEPTSKETRYEPYRIVKAGRLKVGITGMVTARGGQAGRLAESQEIPVTDGIHESRDALAALRKKKVDLAVLVARGGLAAARAMADSVPGYDVILTGERRASNLAPERRGSTIVASTAGGCSWLGELSLTVQRGEVVAFEGRSFELGQDDGPMDEYLKDLTYTKLELDERGERLPRPSQGPSGGG